MSVDTGLYVTVIVAIAASLQGITGAGFMMLSVPVLVVFLPASVAVPGIVVLYLPLATAQLLQLRRDVDLRLLVTLGGSAALMVPFGATVLRDTDTLTMQRAIGWSMIALALVLQLKPGPPFRKEFVPNILAGLCSGFLAASTSVSGPPLVLLGLKQRWEPARFRATLIAYFLVVSLCSLPFYWELELLTTATWGFVSYGFPGTVVGYLVGGSLRVRVAGTAFRWIATGIVILGGLAAALF